MIHCLVECPASMSNEVRTYYYQIIDSVIIEGDWSTNIENDRFFSHQLQYRNYHCSLPFISTYTLLKFIRDCVEHTGDAKRSEFKDTNIYKKWLENQGGSSSTTSEMDGFVYKEKKLFKTQFELLEVFYEHFSDVLVEIQHKLFKNGYLAYLSIHPCDETHHRG